LGKDKTTEKIARLFWWNGLSTDVACHVKTCPACQVSKYKSWKPQGHTFDLKPATKPWEVVHVDFAGPFKHKSPGGYNKVLIFTCAFTKLSVFIRCRDTITLEQLANLYIEHVWKVYGAPGKLVSDNEPILCAGAWLKVHEKLGTKLTHISAYNAKANSPAETMVKNLKAMLRAYEVQGMKWWKVLAACERSYNDSVNVATGFTPFYMNFGRHPYQHAGTILEPLEEQCVAEFAAEYVAQTQSELARVQELAANRILDRRIQETAKRNAKRTPTIEYKIGDCVYLETSALKKSHALAPLRSGPFKVTQVTANGNAVYLEGFRHAFNVDIITPTVVYTDGSNPHLTQHDLTQEVVAPVAVHLPQVPIEDFQAVIEGNLTIGDAVVEIDVNQEATEDPQLEMAEEDEDAEIWGREPVVRIVPSSVSVPSNAITRYPDTTATLSGTTNRGQEVVTLALTNADSNPTGSIPNNTSQNRDGEEGGFSDSIANTISVPNSGHIIRYV